MRIMILFLMFLMCAVLVVIKPADGASADNKGLKQAKLGEKFTLRKGESVAISGTDFKFIFDSIEYEALLATSGQEIHYYKLYIEYRSEKRSEILDHNTAKIDNYEIHCEPPFDATKISFTVNRASIPKAQTAANFQVMGAWRTASSVRSPGIYSFIKK